MQPQGILETALYVADLDISEAFYTNLFGFKQLYGDDRLRALKVGENQVLLLFLIGGSLEGAETSGGFIPPHDGHGQLHMAFRVELSEVPQWREHLKAKNVPIISENRLNAGHSIYFHDPDGHVLELASEGLWKF